MLSVTGAGGGITGPSYFPKSRILLTLKTLLVSHFPYKIRANSARLTIAANNKAIFLTNKQMLLMLISFK